MVLRERPFREKLGGFRLVDSGYSGQHEDGVKLGGLVFNLLGPKVIGIVPKS